MSGYVYRNRFTEQVVERDQRWPRLDNLPDRWELVEQPGAQPAAAKPERPAQSDPKSAWIDYAVANGLTVGAAEAMTKAELIDQFGSDGSS